MNNIKKSFAMEFLDDYKKANKRQFILILVILTMWFITIGYLVYILNDIGVEETTTETTTQEISDIESINNSNIVNNIRLIDEEVTLGSNEVF